MNKLMYCKALEYDVLAGRSKPRILLARSLKSVILMDIESDVIQIVDEDKVGEFVSAEAVKRFDFTHSDVTKVSRHLLRLSPTGLSFQLAIRDAKIKNKHNKLKK